MLSISFLLMAKETLYINLDKQKNNEEGDLAGHREALLGPPCGSVISVVMQFIQQVIVIK